MITSYFSILSSHFNAAFEFIDTALENKNINTKNRKNIVFVHCRMGKSRSAAFVIGYLMSRLNLSLDNAYKHVKNRRVTINPNHFMPQLSQYEKTLNNINLSPKAGLESNMNEKTLCYHFILVNTCHVHETNQTQEINSNCCFIC